MIFFSLKSKPIKTLRKGLLYLKLKKNQINGKKNITDNKSGKHISTQKYLNLAFSFELRLKVKLLVIFEWISRHFLLFLRHIIFAAFLHFHRLPIFLGDIHQSVNLILWSLHLVYISTLLLPQFSASIRPSHRLRSCWIFIVWFPEKIVKSPCIF